MEKGIQMKHVTTLAECWVGWQTEKDLLADKHLDTFSILSLTLDIRELTGFEFTGWETYSFVLAEFEIQFLKTQQNKKNN